VITSVVSLRNILSRPTPKFYKDWRKYGKHFLPLILLRNYSDFHNPEDLNNRMSYEGDFLYSKSIISVSDTFDIRVFYDLSNSTIFKNAVESGNANIKYPHAGDYKDYLTPECKVWIELKLRVTNKRELVCNIDFSIYSNIKETHFEACRYLIDESNKILNKSFG